MTLPFGLDPSPTPISVTDRRTIALNNENRLPFCSDPSPKLTHYAFRYPAKFHIPVVRTLIQRYTRVGSTCLDPFTGSGTLLVEAAVRGRNAVGLDVDPVAVFVSRVKTTRMTPHHLHRGCQQVSDALHLRLSADVSLRRTLETDISETAYRKRISAEDLRPPPIPNLNHWFRRSVIIQLARIKSTILQSIHDPDLRDFMLLCFASMIRPCSNADPTPVSGLEVTTHMRQKEAAGRTIDVEREWRRALKRCTAGAIEFFRLTPPSAAVTTAMHDARHLADCPYTPDAIVTSPPYHSAVDYYRRHQLEMYWLDLVTDHADRANLIPTYLGRARVAKKHMPLTAPDLGSVGRYWYDRIRSTSAQRADDFIHYYCGMSEFFTGAAHLLPPGRPLVLVVGNNKIHGTEIDPSSLFSEISEDHFRLSEQLWYPLKNRYMSYRRHNGASIDKEYVLGFRRK